mgnify:CR=1 FL=1
MARNLLARQASFVAFLLLLAAILPSQATAGGRFVAWSLGEYGIVHVGRQRSISTFDVYNKRELSYATHQSVTQGAFYSKQYVTVSLPSRDHFVVQCFDLYTKEVIWKRKFRGGGGQWPKLVESTDNPIVHDARTFRCLDLANGATLWEFSAKTGWLFDAKEQLVSNIASSNICLFFSTSVSKDSKQCTVFLLDPHRGRIDKRFRFGSSYRECVLLNTIAAAFYDGAKLTMIARTMVPEGLLAKTGKKWSPLHRVAPGLKHLKVHNKSNGGIMASTGTELVYMHPNTIRERWRYSPKEHLPDLPSKYEVIGYPLRQHFVCVVTIPNKPVRLLACKMDNSELVWKKQLREARVVTVDETESRICVASSLSVDFRRKDNGLKHFSIDLTK